MIARRIVSVALPPITAAGRHFGDTRPAGCCEVVAAGAAEHGEEKHGVETLAGLRGIKWSLTVRGCSLGEYPPVLVRAGARDFRAVCIAEYIHNIVCVVGGASANIMEWFR